MTGEWQKVTMAANCVECPCGCEEPWCEIHDDHYADCDCIWPTEDDVEYEERDGELWGRRLTLHGPEFLGKAIPQNF